jgi:hypothetical protein
MSVLLKWKDATSNPDKLLLVVAEWKLWWLNNPQYIQICYLSNSILLKWKKDAASNPDKLLLGVAE